jgi:chemotaxis protein CheZ
MPAAKKNRPGSGPPPQEQETSADLTLDLARDLVLVLENGPADASRIHELLAQLTVAHESALLREVGKLTRELHNALTRMQMDPRVMDIAQGLAEIDMGNARNRLGYVLERTEDAAHRTLAIIEETLPLTDQINKDSARLAEEWRRFTRREIDIDGFRLLSDEIQAHLDRTPAGAQRLHDGLSDVLMAQEYQDLTGQMIHRVIGLVQEVEDKLVNLIRLASSGRNLADLPPLGRPDATEPAVAATSAPNTSVRGQDEVDALLSSLGF